MKKALKFYIAVWAVLLVLFNVIAFVSVGWEGQEKYTPSFWIGYVFITVMFVGQLLCSLKAFNTDDSQKLFYNIPLIKVSYTGLIVSFVVGGLCMLISPLPYWIGVIVCAVMLVLNVLSVVKATVAVEEVTRVDQKIKVQTFFIKSLTVDADTLMASAKSEAVKAECRKVYEAVRYSDPMSNEALSEIEESIQLRFAEFSASPTAEMAEELLVLVAERNKKCKLLK